MTFWRRRRADHDFQREIEAHLALEIDRLIDKGMTADQAYAEAHRSFGNATRAQERFYESRRVLWLDALGRDVRSAARGLIRTPGFSALAILTLALGIGATTATFSVIRAVLLRPLPYDGAHRIVRIYEEAPGAPDDGMRPVGLTKSELDGLMASSWTLTHAGVYLPSTMTLSGRGPAARLNGIQISPALLAMLRVEPAIGRTFEPHEDAPLDRVVVLSQQGWRRHFGADPNLVGRTVPLDGTPYSVIGIMPTGFSFPEAGIDYWVPFVFPARASLVVTARVRDGIDRAAAALEVGRILDRFGSQSTSRAAPPPPPPPPALPPRADGRPRTLEEVQALQSQPLRPGPARVVPDPPREPRRIRLLGLQDFLLGAQRQALLIMAIAVGVVLLIACANVANLLLARGAARQPELAIRLAIGASRGRLIRQLLTESLVLAAVGSAVGTAFAIGAVQVFHGLGPTLPRAPLAPEFGIPRLDEAAVDAAALLFTATVALLAGVFAGVIPALRHSVASLHGQLRAAMSSTDSGWRWSPGSRLRPLLVVLELALATVLFVSAVLLIRSFVNLAAVHPGYDPAGVLSFQVVGPPNRTADAWSDELRERIASAAGVEAVAVANQLPMSGRRGTVHLRRTLDGPVGPPPPPAPGGDGPPQFPSLRIASPNFTEVMRARIIEGRGLLDSDVPGAPPVMLINQVLARSGYLGPEPIGQEIYAIGSTRWRVVGIVEDMRQSGLDEAAGPEVIVPLAQFPLPPASRTTTSPFFAVRTAVSPASAVPAIRAALSQYDPHLGLDRVATMEDIVANTLVRPKFFTTLLTAFAAVAVVLAVTGIYGVLSFMVRQRSREMGIRMSLGASRAAILRLVLREGAWLSTAGLVLGLALSIVATRSLGSQLFGVMPADPLTYVGVALTYGLVSALASYVPARRATRVDPVIALRSQ